MSESAYYTNSEARKVLGNISSSKLKSYVDRGIINKYIPPGQVYGMYLKSEIDALAEENKRFFMGKTKSSEEISADGKSRFVYCI